MQVPVAQELQDKVLRFTRTRRQSLATERGVEQALRGVDPTRDPLCRKRVPRGA
jgi:hypothetical protein